MPRSRSRSPARRERDRRRSRSRERRSRSRERRHRHRRSRSPRSRRSRSHSPRRRSRSGSPSRGDRRSRSRERETAKGSDKTVSLSSSHLAHKEKPDKVDLKAMPKDEQDMMKLMGFSSFETTKNKKVEGNDIYVTNLTRKRRYRQYMNRRGGFNRPLDFIA